MVCTPAQPPRHLLSSDRQLSYPVFIFLKTRPQQNALFPVPIEVFPVTIQPLLKRPLHDILPSQDFSQLTPQVSYQPSELGYLVLQSPNIAIHLLLLDEGLLIHPDTPIGEELTWAVFIAIWPHSCSPMTAEYLIADRKSVV